MRLAFLRLFGLALLSALLQLTPFPVAGPVSDLRRLVSWVCLVPLLLLLCAEPDAQPLGLRRSAGLSYLCGVVWFAGNCYWIYQTMHLYGGLPALAALGILVLFSLYLGLYFGLFGLCFALLRQGLGRPATLALSPVLWVAVELARDRITGFPWDLLGYTQIDNRFLTPLAPWTGVMGLSLVVAAGNLLWLWRPRWGGVRRGWVGPACGAVVVLLSYTGEHRAGEHRAGEPSAAAVPASRPEAVAVLVQDNLNVGAEAGPPEGQPALLARLAEQTLHPAVAPAASGLVGDRPALVAWPEAPTPFSNADPAFRQALGQLARTVRAPVVVDAVAQTPRAGDPGQVNDYVSASFFLPDGTYAGRYDKMHLVPFGEYTPFKRLFFFAGHLLDGLNFVPGRTRRIFSVDGRRYGIFICYESIFGDEIRQFALRGAQVLVNLTDDGWYGDTSAPWEHLDMARMRAIENDRWLLRDTNTGLTASIDPAGQIVAAMPRHVAGAVVVPFAYRGDLTFYTRHGDWIGLLCAIVTAAVLLGGALQRRYPYRPPAAGTASR